MRKQFTNCDSLGGSAVVSEYTSNMHQIAACTLVLYQSYCTVNIKSMAALVCKQFTNCDSLGGSAVVSEYTSNMHQIAAHSTRVIVQ